MVTFNERADTYQNEVEQSIAFAGVSHADITAHKVEHLLRICARLIGPPSKQRILDVGCGVGLTDALLVDRVGELHGIDISPESIERARLANPAVRYTAFDGTVFPLPDASVDAAFAICVLHHVPPEQWIAFAAELRRVVRPSGVAVIFEHNPLNPLTRLAVNRCEFDCDAHLLRRRTTVQLLRSAGLLVEQSSYILFTRRPHRVTRVDDALRWCGLGAQYYVAARRSA
jgi:SAM-dependent methyltransferase